MPEIIIDGRGNAYAAGVSADNRLMVDAALTLSGTFSLNNAKHYSFTAHQSGVYVSMENDTEAFQIQNIGTTVPIYYFIGSIGSPVCVASGCLVYAQESQALRLNISSGAGITMVGSPGNNIAGRFISLW